MVNYRKIENKNYYARSATEKLQELYTYINCARNYTSRRKNVILWRAVGPLRALSMASRPTGPPDICQVRTVCRMEVAGLAVRLIPVHTQVFQHHNIMGMLFFLLLKSAIWSFLKDKNMIIVNLWKGVLVCRLVYGITNMPLLLITLNFVSIQKC